MKIELKELTVRELTEGYQDNNEAGVVGYNINWCQAYFITILDRSLATGFGKDDERIGVIYEIDR